MQQSGAEETGFAGPEYLVRVGALVAQQSPRLENVQSLWREIGSAEMKTLLCGRELGVEFAFPPCAAEDNQSTDDGNCGGLDLWTAGAVPNFLHTLLAHGIRLSSASIQLPAVSFP